MFQPNNQPVIDVWVTIKSPVDDWYVKIKSLTRKQNNSSRRYSNAWWYVHYSFSSSTTVFLNFCFPQNSMKHRGVAVSVFKRSCFMQKGWHLLVWLWSALLLCYTKPQRSVLSELVFGSLRSSQLPFSKIIGKIKTDQCNLLHILSCKRENNS